MNKIFLLFFALMLSCTSTKNIVEDDKFAIAFGNGGGFVGIETKYLLKSDGILSRIINTDTTILKHIPQENVANLFKEATALKDYKYFRPGNIYQFVEINNNRIVWSVTTNGLNTSVITLYNNLKTLLK